MDAEQQLPNQAGYTFEISKQRVDFAGQEIQRVPIAEPEKQYLPANKDQLIFINNQLGTGNRQPQTVNNRHSHRHNRRGNGHRPERPCTPQTPPNQTPGQSPGQLPGQLPGQFPGFFPGLIPTLPPRQPPTQTPTTQQPPVNIPETNPSTDEKFEAQQRPAAQYGPPNYNIDPRNNRPSSQYDGPNIYEPQQKPAQQYGAPNYDIPQKPAQQYGVPSYDSGNLDQQQQPQKPALQYGPPADYNEEEEQEKQFALDALNAAVKNYNRLQEDNSEKIAQGQYFVVNPDHSIQKVKFTTSKSNDETKPNDFTAELKYTKVGEINDPLYKYTAEGQLVRIVKK